MQSLHLRGRGGGAYWIQGVYSRLGVYEMIFTVDMLRPANTCAGKMTAPSLL